MTRRAPSAQQAAAVVAMLVLAVAIAVGVAGCSSDDDPAPLSEQEELGQAVYARSCAPCHGGELRGTTRGPAPLSMAMAPDQLSDDAMRAAIVEGTDGVDSEFGPMSPMQQLADAEVDGVIAYLRAEQARQGLDP